MRDPDSYVSADEAKRARQLANLPNLRGLPTSTSIAAGEARALKHGARSRHMQASPDWSPAIAESARLLVDRLDTELIGEDGEPLPWARSSIEALAVLRVQMMRAERYAADAEAKGKGGLEDPDLVSKVAERFQRALDREAQTLSSRVTAAGAVAAVNDAHAAALRSRLDARAAAIHDDDEPADDEPVDAEVVS